MRRRMVTIGLVAAVALLKAQDDPRRHAGVVQNAVTGGGIPAAIVAYKDTSGRQLTGRCPEYGSRDGATNAIGSGLFLLPVTPSLPSYVAVYCLSGFYPREETRNDNALNARVTADPVTLFPLSADPKAVAAALRRDIDRLSQTLRYADAAFRSGGQPQLLQNGINTASEGRPEYRQILDLARRLGAQ